MTITFLLIRHGQTDWNVARRWQGHIDQPLNETGIAQAQALARRLRDWPVTAVYTSDLQRAHQTAVVLGKAWQLAPQIETGFRERDVGVFAGMTGAEARQKYPDAWNGSGTVNPPGGETMDALRERAHKTFDQIVTRHETDEMIAVVSHGGLLYGLIAHVLGLPVDAFGRFQLSGNTGLSLIEVNSRGPTLSLLNDTSHLEQQENPD